MVLALSGRSHQVLTGIAVCRGSDHAERLVTTEVWFRVISQAEAEKYVATGESDDKSGAYGIQGIGGIFVQRINGSADNVAGLPVCVAEELLKLMGVDTWHVRERQNLLDCR
jgi:septum formation protein